MKGDPQPQPAVSRVFLVDDQFCMRRGLSLLVSFEPDLEVCGEAEDAADAFRRICKLRPDVAIVDLELRDSNGLELIERLRVECPDVRILVVTMHDQIASIHGAFRAGAHGYLTKDESAAHLIPALHQILEGRRYFSGGAAPARPSDPSFATPPRPHPDAPPA